jgi:hypothetical protein
MMIDNISKVELLCFENPICYLLFGRLVIKCRGALPDL